MDTNNLHGARTDDDIRRDTRGGKEARERLEDTGARPDLNPDPDGDGFSVDDARSRSALARLIDPSVFPARPGQLRAAAEAHFANGAVLAAIDSLPDRVFGNVQEVWKALGGPSEHRR